MSDTALQRKNMVESQVRPSDVTDRRITAAMSVIPREAFVPEALAPIAYMDGELCVGPEAGMVAPRTLARLIQLAGVEPGEKILVLGTWPGYAAAVLAHMGGNVTVLSPDAAASEKGKAAFAAAGLTGVQVVTGSLVAGHAAGKPYDLIFIEGRVPQVSEALLAQLSDFGRVVGVEPDEGVDRAVRLERTGSGVARRAVFEASAPVLAEFERTSPEFVF